MDSTPNYFLHTTTIEMNMEKYKKRDDASSRLAEKMLQGWTLLGENCPVENCSTPFVRNKQGQMYCVNCEKWAISEEAQQRNEQTTQVKKQKIEFEAESHDMQTHRSESSSSSGVKKESSGLSLGVKKTAHETGKSTQEEHLLLTKDIHEKTVLTVYEKMEVMRELLITSTDLDQTIRITKAIKEFADTLKILKSFSS